jgi:transmembrane sensor
MDKNKFIDLSEKYSSGKCSLHEKELLEKYLESFQNNSDEWINNEMGNRKIIEEKIYSVILHKIDKENKQNITRVFYSPELLKRAASIIFILILASGILYVSGTFKQKTDRLAWKEKVTQQGEYSKFTLPDGSVVTLNAASKLKYPVKFNNTSREIYLEGEAYFDVYHNTNQPFIVHTENLATTVLGTKFDVSAYPTNATIAVSLFEGSVKVSRNDKEKISEVIFLKPKEQLYYNKEKNISLLEQFDSLDVVGWRDSVYKFENKTLYEVIPQLERAFGVKFRFDDQSVLKQRITIKFQKKSLQTIADVIENLIGFRYKIIKIHNEIKEIHFFRRTR